MEASHSPELSPLIQPVSDAIDTYLATEAWVGEEDAEAMKQLVRDQFEILVALHAYASAYGVSGKDYDTRNRIVMAADEWLCRGKNPFQHLELHFNSLTPYEMIAQTVTRFMVHLPEPTTQMRELIMRAKHVATDRAAFRPDPAEDARIDAAFAPEPMFTTEVNWDQPPGPIRRLVSRVARHKKRD